MKDRELAVGILVDPHLGPDEVGAGGMGRDLEPPTFPGDGVVGRHRALLLDRQDVAVGALKPGLHAVGAGTERVHIPGSYLHSP